MCRRKLSKASQEWLWTNADQNDSFSDSSYLFPIQPILQNWVLIARTEANSILDLGEFNEAYLPLAGSNPGTFFGRTDDDAVIDWLIKSVHLTSPFAHSPALNHPLSLLGHRWPTFSLFLPAQSSSSFCCEQNFFLSSNVQNAKGVSKISEWPSNHPIKGSNPF